MIRKLERLFLLFFITSVIGWIYEVFLEVVIYRWGFSDRGVLTGPYCPVYGVGAIAILLLLGGLKKRRIYIGKLLLTPIFVFVAVVITASVIELIASYIMEWTSGSWMWDYTRFSFNFEGRIALNPSLRFGVGGMAFLYVVCPCIDWVLKKIPKRGIDIGIAVLGAVFFIDCICYIF